MYGLFNGGGTNYYGSTVFNVDDWVDLALVCESNTLKKFYVNGVLEHTYAVSFTFPSYLGDVQAACILWGTPHFSDAACADLRITNTALDVEWILAEHYARLDTLLTISLES